MVSFYFYHPIEVRYGDLDPQGHVNNAKYLTYLEQARIEYIRRLGLWEDGSWLSLGVILADVQITYKKPVTFGMSIRVGARIISLGNKSMKMEYCLVDSQEQVLATGSTVLVAYDYKTGQSISIPAGWRKAIREFEKME